VLKEELEVDAELKPGPSGSFIVEVDGRPVVRKDSLAFPSEKDIVDAVSKALEARPGS
jgi:selenoprotein W-related protein